MHRILNFERSDECIDFTIVWYIFFFFLRICKLFRVEKILITLTLRVVSNSKWDVV